MDYEIASKRFDQFNKINKYALEILRHTCIESKLKIIGTSEIETFKMGKTGVFALTLTKENVTKHVEVSFGYENDIDQNVTWYPQKPEINIY